MNRLARDQCQARHRASGHAAERGARAGADRMRSGRTSDRVTVCAGTMLDAGGVWRVAVELDRTFLGLE